MQRNYIKRINFYILFPALFLFLFWGCSDDNPLTNQHVSGNLIIRTEKSDYYSGQDFTKYFATLSASVVNNSTETFYAKLGDAYEAGMDHEQLLMAAGNDGYFEMLTNSGWKQLNRGILIEGSKVIRILPKAKYNLHATAYIDSNTAGKFRLRINYYRSDSSKSQDTLTDISNIFNIHK